MRKAKNRFLLGALALGCTSLMALAPAAGYVWAETDSQPTVRETVETDGDSGDTTPAKPAGYTLYEKDFSSGVPEDLQEQFSPYGTGGAVLKGTEFVVPIDEWAESNNYEFSFDVRIVNGVDFGMNLRGLMVDEDGNVGNMYVLAEGGGQFWSMRASVPDGSTNWIYNNSGDEHGALDGTPVLTGGDEFVSVKLIHFEGYVELWLNGSRRIVTHLCNFGNNNYNTRGKYTEGTINQIDIFGAASSIILNSIKVKEAVAGGTSYTVKNENGQTGAYNTRINALTAQNLYSDNFKAELKLNVVDDTKSGYYPTIRLFGLNTTLTAQYTNVPDNAYFMNVQCGVDGNTFTPGVFYPTPNPEGGVKWGILNGEAVQADENGDMTMLVEVYGDVFDLYLNDTRVIHSSFTEMGFEKGHLQYIMYRDTNPATGSVWKEFTYKGYDKTTAVELTADKDRLLTGEELTVSAYVFGEKPTDLKWYVDGVEQTEETGLTLTLSDLADGEHTVEYKNATVAGNTITVTSSSRRVTVSSDVSELYPTEEVTFTANVEGDFTGETLEWYVNGEKQEETGATLTLSGLAVGEYTVVYKTDTVTSNEAKVTVKAGFVTVETAKNSYFTSESATFTAKLTGIPSDAAIKWFVNGTEVAGETGKTLTLEVKNYNVGEATEVYCTANGSESKKVTISVVYDVKASIEANENYKELDGIEIKEGETYGDYLVGKDDDGNYLYTTKVGGPYWQYSGKMPTGMAFIFEYKIYVPEDIAGKYYIYPTLSGMNSAAPNSGMETSVEVNTEGIRPYIKDQSNGQTYDDSAYGFGLDLSYGAGIVNKGEWIPLTVAVENGYISMYINGELALFFRLSTATVCSAVHFNMWPDAGDTVPVRMKDFKFGEVGEPVPDLTAVNVSVSAVDMQVGGSITATASPVPFNAETNVIKWYLNGVVVEGENKLTYTLKGEKAGEYKIVCEIDGIKSAEKTVTVKGGESGGKGKKGCKSAAEGMAVGAIALTASAAVVLVRRKRNK